MLRDTIAELRTAYQSSSGEIGRIYHTWKEALIATVGGTGLAVAVSASLAYKVVADTFGNADAPVVCSALCCGIPVFLGGGIWLIYKQGQFSMVSERVGEIRDRIYGNSENTPATAASAASPIQPEFLDDPIGVFADSFHLLVIGHTGGGKTTLLHEICRRLDGDVFVVDADAAPGQWPGAKKVVNVNLQAVEDYFVELKKEFSDGVIRRTQQGEAQFPKRTILIDEYSWVSKVPVVREVVEDILRRGRKYNTHLFVGVQDKQVKTLNFEGNGELRSQFTWIVNATKKHDTGERSLWIQQGDQKSVRDSFRVTTPELPDPESFITKGAVLAPVPVLGVLTPETAVPQAEVTLKMIENGVSRTRRVQSLATTDKDASAESLLVAVKRAYFESKAFSAYNREGTAYTLLRTQNIALLIHSGISSENLIMRMVFGGSNDRYREYVKLINRVYPALLKMCFESEPEFIRA